MIPNVSIIIPIYNTGKYLHKCLQSLLLQTLKDIEIILVDDGSKDDSGKICDEYESKDCRVRVIHKKNEGVSIARNTGIKAACGEYIGFVDSDDWVEPNMFEDLFNIANREQVDIVMCDTVTVYGNGNTEPDTIPLLPNSCLVERSAMSPQLLLQIAGSACRCIYRKDLLFQHGIAFPVGLKFSEDRIFNIMAFGCSKAIYYDKCARYNRFVRKGSAVNRYHNDRFEITLNARQHIRDAIDLAWNRRKDLKDAYEQQTVAMALLAVYNEFHKECKESLKSRYKNVYTICKDTIIQNAVATTGVHGLGSKLLSQKRVLLLCMIAILFNIKNMMRVFRTL